MRPWFIIEKLDAVAMLSRLPERSVDCVVTDPAYESLEKHGATGTTTRLVKSWFPIFPNSRFDELFAELWRVMRVDSHLYFICDQETMFTAVPCGRRAGFTFWKPLVWDKVNIGMGYHYRSRYEFALFFEKGTRRIRDLGVPDIIVAKRVVNGYPTEKPEALSSVLIEQSSDAGDIIVDPFAGSGSIGAAALKLGRNFIGSDVDGEAARLCRSRLEPLGDSTPTVPRRPLELRPS